MKLQELDYFLGKICTVFTVPINRNFQTENPKTYPEPMYHYFMGRIVEITSHGIMMEQWAAGPKRLRSFFMLSQIVGIAEEETLNPNNPEDAKLIKQYKEEFDAAESAAKEQVLDNKRQIDEAKEQFLDITKLAELQKHMGLGK
jgi:hypothetical protein